MKTISSSKPIYLPLVLGCLIPLLLAVLVQAVYSVTAQREAMAHGLEAKARSLGSLMVNLVGPSMALDDASDLAVSLGYVQNDVDLAFAAVLLPGGNVGAFSGSTATRDKVANWLQPVDRSTLYRLDDLFLLMAPLKEGSFHLGTVVIALSTEKVNQAIVHTALVSLCIAAAGVAIAVGVVLLLSAALVRRHADVKLLLDSAGQGFFRVTRNGLLMQEHAAILDTWFGSWLPRKPLWEYLYKRAPKSAEWLQLLWNNVIADVLPLEMALEQLPRRVEVQDKTYEFKYTVVSSTKSTHVMGVVSDVTAEIAHQRTEAAQQELMGLFRALRADRAGLLRFATEAARSMHYLGQPMDDMATYKRELHTLKGNSSMYGLESVASCCHAMETQLEEGPLIDGAFFTLQEAWRSVEAKLWDLRVYDVPTHLEISPDEYEQLLAALQHNAAASSLVTFLQTWQWPLIKHRLEHFALAAQTLARRMGYDAGLVTHVEAASLRMAQQTLTAFWNSFSLVVSNALVHGIEPPTERVAAGKSAAGTLHFRALHQGDSFIVELADDGRGINWPALAARGRAANLPTETPKDLAALLFAQGISTRLEVDGLSGRGVGMSSVQAACVASGGHVLVKSEPGQGSCFSFVWPDRVLSEAGGIF